MNQDLRKALKEKARAKSAEEPLELGSMPLEAANARFLPDPADQKIDAEQEVTLHAIICRAGYQRNIHRTEGIGFKSLYEGLLDFFLGELAEAGKVVVDVESTLDKSVGEGVKENGDDRREAPARPGHPEGPLAAGLDAQAGGVLGRSGDAGGRAARPKRSKVPRRKDT